ncbi:MAG: anhydro-N-acetylmuramic acid kinase [Flavobacteriales bacterium]|nr:anhydro-N-acetylmuramic acid kinase [Flavobacteriales bacterium]
MHVVTDPPERHRVLGMMSGSSLDGVDLALVVFERLGERWSHRVEDCRTVAYSAATRTRLLKLMDGSAHELARCDRDLGVSLGSMASEFLAGRKVDLITSHGHTIFHAPDEGWTCQIGHGAWIAASSGVDVVCDLRTMDMAHGGQGAPLVPFGERSLYPDHQVFLNLGGIANLSMHGREPVAFDVCICNQALNDLAGSLGQEYDAGGAVARQGSLDRGLLEELNSEAFLHKPPPRSLGREWYTTRMRPLLFGPGIRTEDALRTVTEHIATAISEAVPSGGTDDILCTGGGAFNTFLMERITELVSRPIVVPGPEVVSYKEAIIFAFLGLMRKLGRRNVLADTTGAHRSSVGGALYSAN